MKYPHTEVGFRFGENGGYYTKRSWMRHAEVKPTDFQFVRNTGLRPWDFADYRPPLDWGRIGLLCAAAFALLTLAFFAWRMV